MPRPWNYARVTRVCAQCEAEFTCPPSSTASHCSNICAIKTQAKLRCKPLVQKFCVVCDKVFSLKESTVMRITCSSDCRKKSMIGVSPPNKLPMKSATCAQCATVFQFPGSTRARKFCSTACHSDAMRGVSTGKTQVGVICKECSKEFSITNARLKSALYCSRNCAHSAKTHVLGTDHPLYKHKSIRLCEYCGESFEARAAGDKRFCSRSCVGASTTRKQGGRRSSIEILVENELLRIGEPFEPSKSLGPWLLDFFLPVRQMVIECDGIYWHSIPSVAARDICKNNWLQQRGYRIARIPEKDIRSNVIGAVQNALSMENSATEEIVCQ